MKKQTEVWKQLKCGCLLLGKDGSKVTCKKHTSKKTAKRLTLEEEKKFMFTKDGRIPKRIMKKAAKALEKTVWTKKDCGCVMLGSDGSFVPCEKHTTPKMKAVLAKSVRLDTPFLEVKPIKVITQADCGGTCPLCGWGGPDEEGIYHHDECPWVADAFDVDELRELRRKPWKGTEND